MFLQDSKCLIGGCEEDWKNLLATLLFQEMWKVLYTLQLSAHQHECVLVTGKLMYLYDIINVSTLSHFGINKN